MDNLNALYNKLFLPVIIGLLTTLFTLIVIYNLAEDKQQHKYVEKAQYHKKMIKSGSISSLVALGEMYEKGQGVKKNLLKAQELFIRAINSSNEFNDEKKSENSMDDFVYENSSTIVNINGVEKEEASENTYLNNKLTKKNQNTTHKILQSKNNSKTKSIRDKIVKVKKDISVLEKNIKNSVKKLVKRTTKNKHTNKIIVAAKRVKSKPVTPKKITSKKRKKRTHIKNKRNYNKKFKKRKRVLVKVSKLKKKSLYANDYIDDKITKPTRYKYNAISDRIKKQDKKKLSAAMKQKKETHFITNPCTSESSKYIAKCKRLSHMRNFSK